MNFVNRYVEVDIMYKVFDLQNKLLESKEWIPCRLNMKQSKKVCRCIEVRAEPMRDEISFAYDFDIDASYIVWKPVSLGDRINAFCFFWTFGGRTCELLLSFEDKSIFDSYVDYLENLMFCLANNIIVTEGDEDESADPEDIEINPPACVLSICSPDSSHKSSHTNSLDANESNDLIHVECNDSHNETDFDLSVYDEQKRSNRSLSTLSSDGKNEDNLMLSNWSLSSFVTAIDDCDENASNGGLIAERIH